MNIVQEKEFSITLSFQSKNYQYLLREFNKAPKTNYSCQSSLTKHILVIDKSSNKAKEFVNSTFRKITENSSYQEQIKTVLEKRDIIEVLKLSNNRILIARIQEKLSIEKANTDFWKELVLKYEVHRKYIHNKNTNVRISLDKVYYENEANSSVECLEQFNIFNEYKFHGILHIEYENPNGSVQQFKKYLEEDLFIHRLIDCFYVINVNAVEDYLNFAHCNLQRNFETFNNSYTDIMYMSRKYDGQRHNFIICGTFLYIPSLNITINIETHFFIQFIVGHIEVLNDGTMVIIDLFIITENYQKTVLEYTEFIGSKSAPNESDLLKSLYEVDTKFDIKEARNTQTRSYHSNCFKRGNGQISHIEAIYVLSKLKYIWESISSLSRISLQTFYRIEEIEELFNKPCALANDGYLLFSPTTIYKCKNVDSVDLSCNLNRLILNILSAKNIKNIRQSSTDSVNSNQYKYPGPLSLHTANYPMVSKNMPLQYIAKSVDILHLCMLDTLLFAGGESLFDTYPNWTVANDNLYLFSSQLKDLIAQHNIINTCVCEFLINSKAKILTFSRIRCDKSSINSVRFFSKFNT